MIQYKSQYGLEVALSIVTLVLIANLTLLMRIRYGKRLVTKLSERPYIVSLWLSTIILIYLAGMCYLTNVMYVDQLDEFYKLMITPATTLNIINTIFFVVRMDLTLLFIATRVYELEALLIFVIF